MRPYRKKRVSSWQMARQIVLACVLSVTGFAMMTPAISLAKDTSRVFSAEAGVIVNRTIQLASNGSFQAALDSLLPLIEQPHLTPYERATLYQMIGQYQYELNHPMRAQAAFETARLSGGLLPDEANNLNVVIAELQIGNGQYQEGGERLEAWVQAETAPKPQYIRLLTKAWMEVEDYDRALPCAERWLSESNKKDRQSYDLLNFLYVKLDLPEKRLNMLSEMVGIWPDDTSLLEALKSALLSAGRDADAFEVAKLQYLGGGITAEHELIELVQYYATFNMPFQAAELLESEMELGRVETTTERLKHLGELFMQARERDRALPIFDSIVDTSDDVLFLATLGQHYSNSKACQKAEAVLEKAILRGYDAGRGYMFLGNCYYDEVVAAFAPLSCNMSEAQWAASSKIKSRNAALAAFKKVPEASRERTTAEKWVKFIETKISADQGRCGYVEHESDLCYRKIKHAYAAEVFLGEFKLEDESCQEYVADYDAEFRVKKVRVEE